MRILKSNLFFHSKLAKKIITVLAFVFIFESLAFSTPILAANGIVEENAPDKNINQVIQDESNVKAEETEDKIVVKSVKKLKITAYNSEPGQTDDSPCIGARGFNLCKHGVEDSIAANFLPMGAKVRIPEYFGDRIFVVRDRMNARFQNRVDVWMIKRSDALKFGIKTATIEIIEL